MSDVLSKSREGPRRTRPAENSAMHQFFPPGPSTKRLAQGGQVASLLLDLAGFFGPTVAFLPCRSMAYQIEATQVPIRCCTDGARGLSRWSVSGRRRELSNCPSLTKTAGDASFPVKCVVYCRPMHGERKAACSRLAARWCCNQ